MRSYFVFFFIILNFCRFYAQEFENKNVIIDSLIVTKEYSKKQKDSIFKKYNFIKGNKVKTKVLFSIDKDGNTYVKKIISPHPIFNNEIIKIFKNLPKFDNVNNKRGNSNNINYVIPITFIINK